MSTATINISLPDSLKSEIEAILATDGYGNTSEFFRDLTRKYLIDRKERQLELILLEGLNSPASPWTKEDVEHIKEVVTQRIKNKQKVSR